MRKCFDIFRPFNTNLYKLNFEWIGLYAFEWNIDYFEIHYIHFVHQFLWKVLVYYSKSMQQMQYNAITLFYKWVLWWQKQKPKLPSPPCVSMHVKVDGLSLLLLLFYLKYGNQLWEILKSFLIKFQGFVHMATGFFNFIFMICIHFKLCYLCVRVSNDKFECRCVKKLLVKCNMAELENSPKATHTQALQ